MADAIFEERRLAEIYDVLDPDRSDLDVYVAMVEELGARSVLDIGCGTGTFACLLAAQGVDVVGVDPAEASLRVAKAKPGAGRVRWEHADAASLPEVEVDLVTMTANVAQVFLTDDEWGAVLLGVHRCLRAGGGFVFETRDPTDKAWLRWNRADSYRRTEIPEVGEVSSWVDLTSVEDELVSFRWSYVFHSDGTVLTSDSTLRFRRRDDIAGALSTAGFSLDEIRDAPDRPGRELVFVASAPADA